MLKTFKYSHLTAKIRAMLGKMLTVDDFEHMMHLNSVTDVAGYLKKNTYYHTYFENIDDNEIHRGELEVLLYRALITDALKIAKFLKGNEKTIYRFVYRKQEIEDLKKMLRALETGKELSSLNRKALFVSRYSKIDFNVSLRATNVRELVETLKDTNFYPILKPLLINDHKIDLFAAEQSLDLYYYRQLRAQIDKITSGQDTRIMNMAYGLDVDYRNMMWIYRAKKFYKVQKELIYTYLIPDGYRLKRDMLVDMVEATTAEEVVSMLKHGPYGDIIDFDLDHWGNSFYAYYGYKQRMNMRLLPGTIAPIVGYIFIKEIEVLNLTTVIEGIRYKVEPDEIKEYLSIYR